jgi:phosphatidylinositol kinase/protein kinase (PI-3  family)
LKWSLFPSPPPQEACQGSAGRTKAETFAEIMEKFRPVFHHFFMEQFPTPPQWFERRLAYTRSVAASSMGKHEIRKTFLLISRSK